MNHIINDEITSYIINIINNVNVFDKPLTANDIWFKCNFFDDCDYITFEIYDLSDNKLCDAIYLKKMRQIYVIPKKINTIKKGINITMNNNDFITKAKSYIVDYFNAHVDVTDNKQLTIDDVYVVWFNYTLGNWKALLSTTVSDGMYYEVTYNANKKETYLDAYKKWDNKVILN